MNHHVDVGVLAGVMKCTDRMLRMKPTQVFAASLISRIAKRFPLLTESRHHQML